MDQGETQNAPSGMQIPLHAHIICQVLSLFHTQTHTHTQYLSLSLSLGLSLSHVPSHSQFSLHS